LVGCFYYFVVLCLVRYILKMKVSNKELNNTYSHCVLFYTCFLNINLPYYSFILSLARTSVTQTHTSVMYIFPMTMHSSCPPSITVLDHYPSVHLSQMVLCAYMFPQHFVDFTLSLTCLQCKNIAQPRMCTRVTACQPGEVTTSFSFITY